MTDSQIFDSVGKIDIGRKLDLSVFGPDLLYTELYVQFSKCMENVLLQTNCSTFSKGQKKRVLQLYAWYFL